MSRSIKVSHVVELSIETVCHYYHEEPLFIYRIIPYLVVNLQAGIMCLTHPLLKIQVGHVVAIQSLGSTFGLEHQLLILCKVLGQWLP